MVSLETRNPAHDDLTHTEAGYALSCRRKHFIMKYAEIVKDMGYIDPGEPVKNCCFTLSVWSMCC
jgi:hypothetical protein